MGYSIKEGQVRVDLFKPSGKWKYSASVDMTRFYDVDGVHEALEQAIEAGGLEGLSEGTYQEWRDWDGAFIVCLEPYHKHSHPITLFGANRTYIIKVDAVRVGYVQENGDIMNKADTAKKFSSKADAEKVAETWRGWGYKATVEEDIPF